MQIPESYDSISFRQKGVGKLSTADGVGSMMFVGVDKGWSIEAVKVGTSRAAEVVDVKMYVLG